MTAEQYYRFKKRQIQKKTQDAINEKTDELQERWKKKPLKELIKEREEKTEDTPL